MKHKIRTTLSYRGKKIVSYDWEANSQDSDTKNALKALQIEDFLKDQITVKMEIIDEESNSTNS